MEKQVLVVDDEEDIKHFLCRLLTDNGYVVRSASDGVEALKAIREQRPDLILLDLMMPHETGTGLYRKLRHTKELKDIPVIVVSGLAGRKVAVSRSVPVIDKPVDEDKLLQAVQEALGG
jgi:CheY-like chemotaxis protein